MKWLLLSLSILLALTPTFAQALTHGLKTMQRVTGNGYDFFMDETPVTYADYLFYVQQGAPKTAYWEYPTYNTPEQPVTGISWIQAAEYCNWRSRCEHLQPVYTLSGAVDDWNNPVYTHDSTANGYRLPTAAEFHFATYGGNPQRYPWGNVFYDSLANYDNDRGTQTTVWWRLAPVKSQFRNAFGLYNLCGNNWHWCDDWVENKRTKYLMGGSWGTVDSSLLANGRFSRATTGHYNYDIGFRCVLPANSITEPTVPHTWAPYQQPEQVLYPEPESIDDAHRHAQLTRFLADHFPESIYFLQPVDSQQILNPASMADLIITTCKKHHVNPLFLTAIMVSESGFGTVSFPRWYNNPMAYHWQNKLMTKGLPVYADQPGKRNRKFATLEQAFDAFCIGIRRDIYYKAALKNLDAFHLIYVGYRADEWMHTLTRVYRQAGHLSFHTTTPEAGRYIYTDWSTIKESLTP